MFFSVEPWSSMKQPQVLMQIRFPDKISDFFFNMLKSSFMHEILS